MRKVKTLTSTKQLVPLITKDQLLRSLPISERTLHRYLKARKLRGYKLDGMLVFNPDDIADFLKRRAVGGPGGSLVRDVEPEQLPSVEIGRTNGTGAQTSYRRMSDAEVHEFFTKLRRDLGIPQNQDLDVDVDWA